MRGFCLLADGPSCHKGNLAGKWACCAYRRDFSGDASPPFMNPFIRSVSAALPALTGFTLINAKAFSS
jgi:hypothetical protein